MSQKGFCDRKLTPLIEVKHNSFMILKKYITIRNIHYSILLQLTARRPPAAHTIFILITLTCLPSQCPSLKLYMIVVLVHNIQ